jgi:AraC-like DNA-binding protein
MEQSPRHLDKTPALARGRSEGTLAPVAEFVYAGVLPQPRPGSALHGHDHWEVCRYFHGTGVTTIGEREFRFEPGTIIAFPPDIPHKEEADAGGFQVYYFGLRHYAPAAVGAQTCRDDDTGSFMHACAALARESQLRQPGWEAAVRDLLDLLVTWLHRWTSGHDELVARTEQALLTRMADPDLRIEDIAGELDVSAKRLRERFRKALGVTPRHYLTRLRLDQARSLLSTGHSVAATAELVGLRDAFYFSRLFRAELGVTPSTLRKKS